MTVVGQSEVDAYACRVLAKHWPDVPNLGDITKITEADVERLGPIDLVCGGFPCQDLSVAGKQGGIKASRSGLFWELMRVVRLVRPRFVLLENVPALLSRPDWMGAVLGELAACGFGRIAWDCVPASALGARHRRDRVFVIAVADAPSEQGRRLQQRGLPADAGAGGQDVADADRSGLEGRHGKVLPECARQRPAGPSGAWPRPAGQWLPEPDVGRVADGVPAAMDTGGLIQYIRDHGTQRESDVAQESAAQGKDGILRILRLYLGLTTTPPGLVDTRSGRGAVSAVPHERGPRSRPMGAWPEEASLVCDLRKLVHAEPLQEAQDVRGGLPFDPRQAQRFLEVGNRVARLRGLGNAVCPQVAEHVGRIIMQLAEESHPEQRQTKAQPEAEATLDASR